MLLSVIFDKIKAVFSLIIRAVKFISSYWLVIWPLLFMLALISNKYWGSDNMFEQLVEAINKYETGQSVDISPGSGEEPNDLKKYIPGER